MGEEDAGDQLTYSTTDDNVVLEWSNIEANSSVSFNFPDFPGPRFECESCGAKFRQQQHRLERFGFLRGYCPNCFLSKIAALVDAPKLEEIEDADE